MLKNTLIKLACGNMEEGLIVMCRHTAQYSFELAAFFLREISLTEVENDAVFYSAIAFQAIIPELG